MRINVTGDVPLSRVFFFLVVFVFSFQHSLGGWTDDETKQLWRDSGFNLDLFDKLNRDLCYKSEVSFASCLMAFHYLLESHEDNPHQLLVSDPNELEIVPFPEKSEIKSQKEALDSEKKRRESFREFTRQLGWTEQPQPQHMGRLDALLEKVYEFVENHIPEPDQPYYLGMSHNKYLKEALDPHAGLLPPALLGNKPQKYFGVGMAIGFYQTSHEKFNGLLAIDPFDGSSAQLSGLKTGDLVVTVDDVPVKGKSIEDVVKAIRGPEDTQMKLSVLSFCDNHNHKEKNVFVTRKPITSPGTDWIKNSRFVNLRQQESPGCKEPVDNGGPQALYVPLKSFMVEGGLNDTYRLCREFVNLQQRDLENERSFGMIIDLRNNVGGPLFTVACMLNTIIGGNDIMVQSLPVKQGKMIPGESTDIHFTDKGIITINTASGPLPMSYNKPIIVLVNRMSVSASEIFAGTIQDMKRGWVVGDRTLGKGSVQATAPFSFGGQTFSKLISKSTIAIYVLNSGRSPQNFGIIPDFRFSPLGEPIEMEDPSEFVSMENLFYDNSIHIENNQWMQNRPDEVAELTTCIHGESKMGSGFRHKIKTDERYKRPFVGDYQLELAKDVLMCSPVKTFYKRHSELYNLATNPYIEVKGTKE